MQRSKTIDRIEFACRTRLNVYERERFKKNQTWYIFLLLGNIHIGHSSECFRAL